MGDSFSVSNLILDPRKRFARNSRVSPQGGVLIVIVDGIGIYGSASESFNVETVDSFLVPTRLLDPTVATQYEGGFKISLLGDRVQSTISGWVRYQIQSGPLAGVGAGIGAQYVGERFGTAANDLLLPEYTVVNGLIYYDTGEVIASLNVNNLTNRQYYSEVGGRAERLVPGTPFEMKLNVTAVF